MRKSWKRLLKMLSALTLVLLTFVSTFTFNEVNAGNVYVPTTNVGSQSLIIRGYSDNSTGGLRTAQTLEVIATGFASDAKLKYTFVSHSTSVPFDVVDAVGTSDIAVRLPVALAPYRPELSLIPYREVKGNFFERLAITVYNAGIAITNATIELTNIAIKIINLAIKGENYLKEQDNKRYRSSIETTSNVFRVQGSGASSPAVEISVVDENPRSSTYQRSAKISYGGYSSANLSYDTNISYGIFANESMSVEALLEQNGVAHVENCYGTTIEGSSISITGSSANVSGKTITAAGEPGESKFS